MRRELCSVLFGQEFAYASRVLSPKRTSRETPAVKSPVRSISVEAFEPTP